MGEDPGGRGKTELADSPAAADLQTGQTHRPPALPARHIV